MASRRPIRSMARTASRRRGDLAVAILVQDLAGFHRASRCIPCPDSGARAGCRLPVADSARATDTQR